MRRLMRRNPWMLWCLSMVMLLTPTLVQAGGKQPKIDTGTTAWMLVSTVLVLLMIPGLAMFYGGLVRTKNVVGTMMHSFIAMAIIGVVWMMFGYGMCFGKSMGWFGCWRKSKRFSKSPSGHAAPSLTFPAPLAARLALRHWSPLPSQMNDVEAEEKPAPEILFVLHCSLSSESRVQLQPQREFRYVNNCPDLQ